MARKQEPQEPVRVEIQYAGPVGTHLVPSPTRKVSTYGMHTRGDTFLVHQADQENSPNIFVLAAQPQHQAVAPPAEKNMQAAPAPFESGAFLTKEVVEEEDAEEKPKAKPVPTTTKATTKETK